MENFGGMIELLQNWTLVMTSHPTIHFPKKKIIKLYIYMENLYDT